MGVGVRERGGATKLGGGEEERFSADRFAV